MPSSDGRLPQVVTQQVGYVLGARAQRRQLDSDDVEAVEQIFAEDAALDALLEILVRRGDHAHVHLHGRLAANAVELAFREHAQQARLQRRGHVADLVEEQRAAIGLLEAAAALRVGAGERAFSWPNSSDSSSSAGIADVFSATKGLLCLRTVLVQGARHQFLSGAGFTGDQHRHARTGQAADRPEHLLHRRRLA